MFVPLEDRAVMDLALLHQTMLALFAIGGLVQIVWEVVWRHGGPDSDSNPPGPGGIRRRPVPPRPSFGCDRDPRRPRASRTEQTPLRTRVRR